MNCFQGRGAIVDAGTLAGGTSVALAAGAIASSIQTLSNIHAFDMFECDIHTPAFFKAEFNLDLTVGGNFRSVYEDMTCPFRRFITIHEGNLLNSEWSGEPIEILSLDVCKSWELADKAVELFLPHLVDGAFILHQDYKTVWLPWIHVWMERLSKYFCRLYETPLGSTVVFQLIRPIPATELNALMSEVVTTSQAIALTRRAADQALTKETATFVELASVILLNKQSHDRAVRLLEDIRITHHTREMTAFFEERKVELRSYLASSYER